MIRKVLIETALILCMTVVPYAAFVYAVRSGHIEFENMDQRFEEIKRKHYGFLND